MKKAMSTIQLNIKKPQVNAVTSAWIPMQTERYSVGTHNSIMTMPLGMHLENFIQNVQPASANPILTRMPPLQVFIIVTPPRTNALATTSQQWLAKRKKWRTIEYRQSYMEAAIEQGVAWQIKINRERRNLTQTELASRIGSKQSGISRAEDPSYGRHSLDTLVKIAHVFDCALQVRFIPYSQLAKDSDDLRPDVLYAKSYTEEIDS
jgi:DNA-binding XRE family transcriptional regulator